MDLVSKKSLGTLGLLLCSYIVIKRLRPGRRYKTRPINRQRKTKGNFQYYVKMKNNDPDQFWKYTRMTVPIFNHLLSLVENHLARAPRSDGLSAEERLIITLQYLSQGCSMQSLAWTFQAGLTTIHTIIHETCQVLWNVLSPVYLKSPSSGIEWEEIAKTFFTSWNFPNCIGALDGKHISIQAPARSGSLFFNYKKNFSIILLAACDANYVFTLVDIGAYGSQSDGGVFKNSIFGQRFENSTMNVSPPKTIPNTNIKVPYVMVADEAFPLKHYIMRPYPGMNLNIQQKIFNYRLSRARRTIENTFGILVARWRILKHNIQAKVENIDHIVKATVVLHNFCMLNIHGTDKTSNEYCPLGYTDSADEDNGAWRTELEPLQSVGRLSSNNASRVTCSIRDTLSNYFVSAVGMLPWQEDRI